MEKREMWVSFYTADGRQLGETLTARNYQDAINQLKEMYEDFGGIADYDFYE